MANLAIFYGKICQFLWQNLAKFRISNGNFLRCQLDFKVDPLGRPRFLILVGSLKGEDNKHSLSLGSGNRWKEKNPLYDFFSCFQCQNWPEVTMCCYNMLCTNAIVECPGPKIKT